MKIGDDLTRFNAFLKLIPSQRLIYVAFHLSGLGNRTYYRLLLVTSWTVWISLREGWESDVANKDAENLMVTVRCALSVNKLMVTVRCALSANKLMVTVWCALSVNKLMVTVRCALNVSELMVMVLCALSVSKIDKVSLFSIKYSDTII